MEKENSIYPRACECGMILKHKQAYNYHIKHSIKGNHNLKTNSKEEKSDDMASKKAKVDFGSDEKNWLFSKIDLFKKAVVKSYGTSMLEDQIALLEDDMNEDDPELSVKVSDLCFQELTKWEQKKVIHQEETITIGELQVY